MKRKLKLLLVAFTLLIGLGIGYSGAQNVNASSTIPRYMRGQFFNLDNDTPMTITARHLKMYKHWRHVHYVVNRGPWKVVHFYHANPIYLHYSSTSQVMHLEYGMSIKETYTKI
ncbi:hypothetical protein [Lentilactobacillus otakiensis]|uniref:hypothetical protein n=1 Tax=Lentilactobacillus otakiensis TaxID=481720 RepID=UPI003D165C87